MPYSIHRSLIYGGKSTTKSAPREQMFDSHKGIIPYDKLISGRGCVIRAMVNDIDTNSKTIQIILLG